MNMLRVVWMMMLLLMRNEASRQINPNQTPTHHERFNASKESEKCEEVETILINDSVRHVVTCVCVCMSCDCGDQCAGFAR